MKEIKIREYTTEDWISVSRIHDQSRPFELKDSCDARAFISLAEDHDELPDFHESRKHVAFDENGVVGFSGIIDNKITWLYVDPEYFGRGIGRRLFVEVSRENEIENGYPCTILKFEKTG